MNSWLSQPFLAGKFSMKRSGTISQADLYVSDVSEERSWLRSPDDLLKLRNCLTSLVASQARVLGGEQQEKLV